MVKEAAVRASTSAYTERLRVPVRWWLQWLLFVATFWVAMVVAVPAAWAWGFTAGLVAMVGAGLTTYGAARRRDRSFMTASALPEHESMDAPLAAAPSSPVLWLRATTVAAITSTIGAVGPISG